MRVLLEQFFGRDRPVPEGLAAEQAQSAWLPALPRRFSRLVETFFEGTAQKVLPVADLGRLDIPIKVAWGTQDRVLPARQAHRLPGRMAVHIFEDVGHMLPQEIPKTLRRLVLEASR